MRRLSSPLSLSPCWHAKRGAAEEKEGEGGGGRMGVEAGTKAASRRQEAAVS